MINVILGVSNLVCALLMILLSIPLKHGLVKMNSWYGFRLAQSFESDELWYKINEYGAKRFIIWSIPIIIIGIFSFLIPFDGHLFLILLFSFCPMIVLIPVFECIQYSKNPNN
jgi:hypothetical protein